MRGKLQSRDRTRAKNLSRREVLHRGAKLGALPFTIMIPSGARAIVFDDETLRPVREREAAFDRDLRDRLAQITRQPPGGTGHPPPPKRPPPAKHEPPPRITYNTNYATSKQTDHFKTTFSNGKPDDTERETYFDGTKEDFKTDVR